MTRFGLILGMALVTLGALNVARPGIHGVHVEANEVANCMGGSCYNQNGPTKTICAGCNSSKQINSFKAVDEGLACSKLAAATACVDDDSCTDQQNTAGACTVSGG
jgi:hypothetical protein